MANRNNRPARATSQLRLLSWGAIVLLVMTALDIVGRIVSGLDFVQYLLNWRARILNFIVFGAIITLLVLFGILWQLFAKGNPYRYIWSAVVLIFVTVTVIGWSSYITARKASLIVLIAEFGNIPGDYYALQDSIFEQLSADFGSNSEVIIETVNEIITPDSKSGSSRARELGELYQADVVIWGWYRSTENPNVTIHIENLNPVKVTGLKSSEVLKPKLQIEDLESFEFQTMLGQQMSKLTMLLDGYTKLRAGKYSDSIVSLSKALEYPDNNQFVRNDAINFYRGISFLAVQDYKSCINDFSAVVASSKYLPEAYANRGLCYYFLSEYQLSLQDLEYSYSLDSTKIDVIYNLGVAYELNNQPDKALQTYTEAINLQPNQYDALNNRAGIYVNFKKYNEALADLNRAITISPKEATAYNNRGIYYVVLGDYDKAIQDLEYAAKLEPDSEKTYYGLASAYQGKGDYDKAIDAFTKAIKKNPQFKEVYVRRALLYFVIKGDYDRAMKDISSAIEIDDKYWEPYEIRGLINSTYGQDDQAVIDFTKAIELSPNNKLIDLYLSRGNSYLNQKDYSNAINDFNKVALLDSNNAEAFQKLGQIYQALGKTAEAESNFNKYEELTGQKP